MIQHCVFIRFQPSVSQDERNALMAEISALVGVLPGLREVRFGPNAGFEALDHGYSHGFIAIFDDAEALLRYQKDPRHQQVGAKLVASAVGGIDGIFVFDLQSE